MSFRALSVAERNRAQRRQDFSKLDTALRVPDDDAPTCMQALLMKQLHARSLAERCQAERQIKAIRLREEGKLCSSPSSLQCEDGSPGSHRMCIVCEQTFHNLHWVDGIHLSENDGKTIKWVCAGCQPPCGCRVEMVAPMKGKYMSVQVSRHGIQSCVPNAPLDCLESKKVATFESDHAKKVVFCVYTVAVAECTACARSLGDGIVVYDQNLYCRPCRGYLSVDAVKRKTRKKKVKSV